MKSVAILLAILIAVLVLPVGGFMLTRREKHVAGTVVDCETNQPVANATVSTQQRGWGFSKRNLIWDKQYSTSTTSSPRGEFQLSYKVGSVGVKLEAEKEGYRKAIQQQGPSESAVIKMLKMKNPGSRKAEDTGPTINCTPTSQCLSCTEENGVTTCRSICE